MKLLLSVDTRIDPRISMKNRITSVSVILPVSNIHGAAKDTARAIGMQMRTVMRRIA